MTERELETRSTFRKAIRLYAEITRFRTAVRKTIGEQRQRYRLLSDVNAQMQAMYDARSAREIEDDDSRVQRTVARMS